MSEIIPATRDVVFKMFFLSSKELLRGFLNEAVGLGIKSTDDIKILNPEITPDSVAGKFARLDINTVIDGKKVNIEMQSYYDDDYIKRDLFYWAKMYTGDLKRGDDYNKLARSISISLMNFNIFDCKEYYSEFCIMEKQRHTPLTDLLSMHFFELPKISGISEETDKTDDRLLWLQLMKAERREELNMLRNTGNTMIQKGAQTLFDLSEDERLHELIRAEDARLHEETSRINSAERRGRREGKKEGLQEGRKEERDRLIKKLQAKGYSNKQIKELLED